MDLGKSLLQNDTFVDLVLGDASQLSAEISDFRLSHRLDISLKLGNLLLLLNIDYHNRELNNLIEFELSLLFGAIALKIINTDVIKGRHIRILLLLQVQHCSEVLGRDRTVSETG